MHGVIHAHKSPNVVGVIVASGDILDGAQPPGTIGSDSTSQLVRQARNDEHVKAVLINIFGGIVRCDMVARGVVEAAKNLGIEVPVVVRLEGTNVEEGQRVIRDSGLNFTVADGMRDAAKKVVALAA